MFSDTPMLGTLADYGGPTQTLALLAGSPAIGAGNASAGISPRPTSAACPASSTAASTSALSRRSRRRWFSATLGQTADAGQPTGAITVELEDLDGNPAPAGSGGVTVSLSSSSTGGSFSYPNGLPITGGQIVIPQGAS